jgi:hypothetical protein
MCEGIKLGGGLGVKSLGVPILGYGYNCGLVLGDSSNLVEPPDIAGPLPDMAGSIISYFFLIFGHIPSLGILGVPCGAL